MNKNDQWFESGDKVMQVCEPEDVLWLDCTEVYARDSTAYGIVYTVVECMEYDDGNLMSLAGLPFDYAPNGEIDGGVICALFRKVEEIKLCVNATKRTRSPELTPA
jgi:hypothetical protein